jgi:hypothetical protein
MIARTGQPDKTDRTVQPGQETENYTVVTGQQAQDCKHRTARTGQGNRTTVTGHFSKDIWDRTTRTGQPGQV